MTKKANKPAAKPATLTKAQRDQAIANIAVSNASPEAIKAAIDALMAMQITE